MNKHNLIEALTVSKSALKLREAVENAIQDGIITREEYDNILTIAVEDGHIDKHEQAILKEFHQMIYDKDIKFKKL